jgi:hypothetical protein
MNRHYDVHLLYNETRLESSASLNGMIMATYLYIGNIGRNSGHVRM